MSIEAATVEAFGVPMPETEHPPTDIENTQASSTSIAPAPFNNVDLDADLIFRTSDNVDFYVHKLILKKAQNHPVVTSFSPSCPSQRLAQFSTVF